MRFVRIEKKNILGCSGMIDGEQGRSASSPVRGKACKIPMWGWRGEGVSIKFILKMDDLSK